MDIATIVNEWFRQQLASGPIARNTEAYNQALGALPDLIARLTPPDNLAQVVAAEPAAKPRSGKASEASASPEPA